METIKEVYGTDAPLMPGGYEKVGFRYPEPGEVYLDIGNPAYEMVAVRLGHQWLKMHGPRIILSPKVSDPEDLLKGLTEDEKFLAGAPTLVGCLRHLKKAGFAPVEIYDIGAYHGDWAKDAAGVFPGVPVKMFEANPTNEEALRQACREIPGAEFKIQLLGDCAGPREFWVLDTGSGIYPELTSFPRKSIMLAMQRLDNVVGNPKAPALVKLDVQGAEIDILRGAEKLLAAAEVVISEASLIPYNQDAPLFNELVHFMFSNGFVVYDFCGQIRRESDNALFQTDVVFVRENSQLRKPRAFFLAAPLSV